ncbi:MAG TPA: sigma-54 dependent transcriptional regulator [Verrucomicrobiota bacterium]|nr:sigma-54 dependent transcriptional regulator [Verrucomicrobiota bacterium]HRT10429.1 sigma-54 dependent transcriptional regulator [Candidatus Paceibacterota bacterium]HRT58044.1 sigma-54 dependent transcriptional regulator [Candidatus Paceibacterota bacterium]
MRAQPRVLLVEDDPGIVAGLRKELQSEGYDVAVALRGDDGLAAALEHAFDVVITDLKMPGLSGLELVERLHRARPKLPILLVTAYGSTETAIEATKRGAYDYVLKPFDMAELLDLVAKAVDCNRLASESIEVGTAQSNQTAIIGNSRAMQAVYKEIGRLAASAVTVLIRGETGTGKELVARALYQHSTRAAQPFIVVNCAAIPETLLESELFGHERGSFTGAQFRRLGRFEQANGGTIFLDEIGDMSPGTQVKLLRVLQEKYIQRVGGNEKIPVDVRVLAATHRDLEKAMQEQQFREDLFYRLSAVTITLPPLSQRTEDIPDLVKYFLRRSATELGQHSPAIQPEAIAFLQAQQWRGNVRELENVVRQSLLLARGYAVGLQHVQEAALRSRRPVVTADQTIAAYFNELLARAQGGEVEGLRARMMEDMERELFTRAIELAQGNQAKAARWLGVTRTTMREKLAAFGVRPAGGKVES